MQAGCLRFLRREPALLQRVEGQKDVTFFSVLEPHGEYNGTAEYVHGADSQIRDLKRARGSDAELIEVTLASGARPDWRGAAASRRSASSTAGAWEQPARITCSSVCAWAAIAALFRKQ